MTETTLFEMWEPRSDARISDDGLYRYWLTRRWGNGKSVIFVMLNPSTADADADDPTIRRCVAFAKTWGFGGLTVLNLFAWRSTDPTALKGLDYDQAVGPENDRLLHWYAIAARIDGTPIVAAWGANAAPRRVSAVREIGGMERLQCLGVTKAGDPRHPLYVRGDTALQGWPAS